MFKLILKKIIFIDIFLIYKYLFKYKIKIYFNNIKKIFYK